MRPTAATGMVGWPRVAMFRSARSLDLEQVNWSSLVSHSEVITPKKNTRPGKR